MDFWLVNWLISRFGEVEQTTDSINCIYLPTLFFDWNKKTPKTKITDYEQRIAISFQQRFELDTIVIQQY